MKSTGMVRKVDELGRIVVSTELRRTLDLAMKICWIFLLRITASFCKKYPPACIFCNDTQNVILYKGKQIFRNCLTELYTVKESKTEVHLCKKRG